MAAKVYTPAPAGARETRGAARRWWVLAVASVAQLMVVLDVTVVNIALPSAQRALAFSDADRQWVVTAYALAFGSLLLLGGKLSDLLGRNRTFLAGLAGVAAASALAGAAPNLAVLAAGRAAHGAFGALLAPAALAHVRATFPGGPAALRAAFAGWEHRAAAPLLPLRVLADRDRAASIIALTLASAGIYSVFLFLTYYLQTVQAYTPVRTGLAFLPMIATTITGSVLGANVLLTRIGPRPTLPLGMLASPPRMAWLTPLTATSSPPPPPPPPLLPPPPAPRPRTPGRGAGPT